MSPPTLAARCRAHPASLAGWTCDACESSLCTQCAAEELYGSTAVESCTRCGGRAVPLRLHRSHRSYASRLLDAVRFLGRPSTLISLGALGLFCTVVGWASGFIAWLAVAGATWAYFFYVFMSAARGVELDVPDFSSLSDLTNPLVRGLIASVYVWGPAVLYVAFSARGTPDASISSILRDPLFLLILGWGLFYGPIAFMVAATHTPFVMLLNPVALVSWVFKLGTDYLIALGVVAGALVFDAVLAAIGGVFMRTGVPILSGFIPHTLGLVMPFFMCHVLGLLLYVHGDKVGYGVESDYYEPVLPGARPQGRMPSKTQRQSASAEAEAERAPVQDAGSALRAVADAVTARDTAAAVTAYQGLASSVLSELAPEQHLFVGRAAASGGNFELAAKAFEKAADVGPDSPVAPQALVLLARLCDERMRNPERAQSVYRYIIHRYPDTDASRFAERRLPPEA